VSSCEDIGSATHLREQILALAGQIGRDELVTVAPPS